MPNMVEQTERTIKRNGSTSEENYKVMNIKKLRRKSGSAAASVWMHSLMMQVGNFTILALLRDDNQCEAWFWNEVLTLNFTTGFWLQFVVHSLRQHSIILQFPPTKSEKLHFNGQIVWVYLRWNGILTKLTIDR